MRIRTHRIFIYCVKWVTIGQYYFIGIFFSYAFFNTSLITIFVLFENLILECFIISSLRLHNFKKQQEEVRLSSILFTFNTCAFLIPNSYLSVFLLLLVLIISITGDKNMPIEQLEKHNKKFLISIRYIFLINVFLILIDFSNAIIYKFFYDLWFFYYIKHFVTPFVMSIIFWILNF